MFCYETEFIPNYVMDMNDNEIDAARKGLMAICRLKNQWFNLGEVEITERYADCTLFKCPACKRIHDDRVQMGSHDPNVRNGYNVIDAEMMKAFFPSFT